MVHGACEGTPVGQNDRLPTSHPARAAPPDSPDPLSHSASPGAEPPAHHSGAAGGAAGPPARSPSGAQDGANSTCCLLLPGLGKAKVTPVLPYHTAVPCVEQAGHRAWHALLNKGSDSIRRSGAHRGQGRWPSVYKAVPTPSMRRREPEGKGVLIYQDPQPPECRPARARPPHSRHPWACSSAPPGPTSDGRLEVAMAAYGGKSRLLVKATGSSVTTGVRRAPLHATGHATGMTMQST